MEHVPPPVEVAFRNFADLVKPGGLAIVSAPYSLGSNTVEHFPSLNEYKIINVFGAPRLINKRRDGSLELFDKLVFHGGPGNALEMRVFSKNHLEKLLSSVGFEDIRFIDYVPESGIIYENECSHVIVARKTKGPTPD